MTAADFLLLDTLGFLSGNLGPPIMTGCFTPHWLTYIVVYHRHEDEVMDIQPVTIVGGGITGLTLAQALWQHDYPWTIYEARSEKAYDGGAALAMAPNAMGILRRLGLAEAITDAGSRIDHYLFVTPSGLPLKSISLPKISGAWNESSWAVPRSHILRTLAAQLQPDQLHYQHPVTEIRTQGTDIRLTIQGGESVLTPLVIGADGAHSQVRDSLWTNLKPPQYQGFVAIRGVAEVDLPTKCQHAVIQVWGGAGEFGFSPLGKGKVYWFATLPWNDVENPPAAEQFYHHFHRWFDPIGSLMRTTMPEEILIHPIFDRLEAFPVPESPVTLIGDAAHLMTPNTGQGACQGMVDAFVLAQELNSSRDAHRALMRYRERRLESALTVARRSHRLGQLIHLPMPAWIKMSILRAIPTSVVLSTMKKVVGDPQSLEGRQVILPGQL